MTTRITDSALYGHLWGTAEARAILGEEGRLRGWLEVLAALARAQAAAGVIPADSAALISENALSRADLGYAAEQTRQSSHSMLGLIRALQQVLPPAAREYVYVGATVQDITDTATAAALRRIGGIAWRDLRRIEELLLGLAVTHRSTVLAGRTHGQPGSPVTFGWKAATWTGWPKAPRAGWWASSAAARAAWSSTAAAAWRCGPGSALSSAWQTRASPGCPPGTASRSSAVSSRWSAGRSPGSAARCTSCSGRRSVSWPSPPQAAQSAASRCRTSATPRPASTSTRWPGSPGRTRPCWPRAWRPSTSGTAAAGRPSGSRCPRCACWRARH